MTLHESSPASPPRRRYSQLVAFSRGGGARLAGRAATGVNLTVDLTPDGRLTSVEVLARLRALESPVDWMTLVEAAHESGLTPDTLRRQVRNRRLTARKRGRDWLVSRAALWTYLE